MSCRPIRASFKTRNARVPSHRMDTLGRYLALLVCAPSMQGCWVGSSGSSNVAHEVVVRGVMRLDFVWDETSEVLEACAGRLDGSLLGTPLVLDTEHWTELELPLLVENGGPANAEGTRFFDDTITPAGTGLAFWACDHRPEPGSSEPLPESRFRDSGFGPTSPRVWTNDDAGAGGDGPWFTDGDGSSAVTPAPGAPVELVLHARDPSQVFCLLEVPVDPWRVTADYERIPTKGETVVGGGRGVLVVHAVPRALGEDIDFELRMGSWARECCPEIGDGKCEAPLGRPACDRLRAEVRTLTDTASIAGGRGWEDPFETYVTRWASRPETLWMQLNLQFEFRDPYGKVLTAWHRMSIGFCRGCGGFQPRSDGRALDPAIECLARRLWVSPSASRTADRLWARKAG